MKKRFALILALVAAVSVFASFGCDEKKETDGAAAPQPTEVLLNSFENYREVHDFYYSGTFRLDCVKEHATEGEGAVRYTVSETAADKKTSNVFGVPLYNLEGTKNYRDFSRMTKITFDVYNAYAAPVTIATSILQKKIGLMYSNVQMAEVAAGQQAEITYSVNRYEIFYSLGIDGPTHVNVTISGVNPEVYVDNMVLHYGEETFVAPDAEIAENEILSFERAYQSFVTYTTGTVLKSEVVVDAENAPEGFRYARVYRDGVADGTAVWGGKFGISANYMGNMNFNLYPAGAYIAFDYKATWNGSNMWVVPRLVSSVSNAYANIRNLSLPCDNAWHTVCIPLSFAPAFFDNLEISFDGGTYGDVYLDDFRMETELPEGAIVATEWGTT